MAEYIVVAMILCLQQYMGLTTTSLTSTFVTRYQFLYELICSIPQAPHTNSASSSSIPAHEVVDPTAMHQADQEFHRAEDRREKHNGHFIGQSEIRIQKVFQNLKQSFREVQ